jgi:RNA polymerase sigma-70 factor, ECF subfamily
MDDERDAVRRCQDGDASAFELIVERYGSLLTGTAYLMLRDRGEAEDAVQDAFVSSWRGIGTFDSARPLRPWLVRVLVNEVLQRQRRKALPVAAAGEARLAGLVSGEVGPERAAEGAWEREEMAAALARLPGEAARVVVLRYFSELSNSEVGEVLGVPEGTVKSRLHRALGRLREELTGSELAPHRGESGEEVRR